MAFFGQKYGKKEKKKRKRKRKSAIFWSLKNSVF